MSRFIIILLVFSIPSFNTDIEQQDQKPVVVISQIYGGGGNSGAAYQNDFVELFNVGGGAADLTGWSIQYASATRTNWQKLELSGVIEPGSYFLVQLSGGSGNGDPLPSPDIIGGINLSATAGKVALVGGTLQLGATCPPGPDVIDLVGYGSNASCFEGTAPAPALSSRNAAVRTDNGCTDTDDNSADFNSALPIPRNSTVSAHDCARVTADPGTYFPETSSFNDQKPGSILFYPIYSSSSALSISENTRINITNSDSNRPVSVRLLFFESGSAAIALGDICLSPNQTAGFLASDIDPDVTGYLVAVAVDSITGCPVMFNSLIGDAFVKFSSGHKAALAAHTIAAISVNPADCDQERTDVKLLFDGQHYNRLPSVLAVSNLPSMVDGNNTLLVLARIDSVSSTDGRVFGLLYDDRETAFSIEIDTSSPHTLTTFSNNFPGTLPRLSNIIPAGRSGWVKLWRQGGGAIIGAMINHNGETSISNSAFSQGHNLHALATALESRLVFSAYPPVC